MHSVLEKKMPRIRCHYLDCGFLDDGYCSAAAVEIDPDAGCMTYYPSSDTVADGLKLRVKKKRTMIYGLTRTKNFNLPSQWF